MFVDKDNHSFIPFRFLSGYAGITTTWNATEKRMDIVKKDVKLTLYLGQAAAYINDKPVSLTELAFSNNGTTYVPLSFVSEPLSLELKWNKMASSLSLKNGETSKS
ncbi:copper amine oxidase N-terminal domain-containing protein [Paenibacillus sp. BR2-3]|uniref:copper amine oxidase N-terminal domain-containing protein n=1 Tax=Paenibacillus sp. BR2-3 TaxID=3048494 RepID=UPI0039773F23